MSIGKYLALDDQLVKQAREVASLSSEGTVLDVVSCTKLIRQQDMRL